MCLSHLIYTVRTCLIHTCHAAPMPCSDHAVLLKATARPSLDCCDLEKNGMVRAWHRSGMASVNQTRTHCVNQMGKTHSKPLRHGMAGERHGHGMLGVNRPLIAFFPIHTSLSSSHSTSMLLIESLHETHTNGQCHEFTWQHDKR